MIYQKMELTIRVEWLDPENSDKQKRRATVKERLLKMFGHEVAEQGVDKHGIKIEVVAVDGIRIANDREIKEPSEVSSSGSIPSKR
jgi:hypothetical protein